MMVQYLQKYGKKSATPTEYYRVSQYHFLVIYFKIKIRSQYVTQQDRRKAYEWSSNVNRQAKYFKISFHFIPTIILQVTVGFL